MNRSSLFIIGGWLAVFIVFSTFNETAAHSASWKACHPLNTARDQFAGGVIDGKIFVFGGNNYPNGANLNSIEMFDPAAGLWVNKEPNNLGVEEVSGAVVNGKLYVFGGEFSEEYDPVLNKWTPKAPMPTPRGPVAAVVFNGRIYLFAGHYKDENGTKIDSDVVEAYDPGNNSWQMVTHMPEAVASPAVAVVGDKAYVIGGSSRSEGKLRSDVWMYSFTTDTWTTTDLAPLPSPRAFECSGAAPVLGSRIYLIGGVEISGTQLVASNKIEVYDTASNTWETKTPLPTPLENHLAVFIGRNLYVGGGSTAYCGGYSDYVTGAFWKYLMPTFDPSILLLLDEQ